MHNIVFARCSLVSGPIYCAIQPHHGIATPFLFVNKNGEESIKSLTAKSLLAQLLEWNIDGSDPLMEHLRGVGNNGLSPFTVTIVFADQIPGESRYILLGVASVISLGAKNPLFISTFIINPGLLNYGLEEVCFRFLKSLLRQIVAGNRKLVVNATPSSHLFWCKQGLLPHESNGGPPALTRLFRQPIGCDF